MNGDNNECPLCMEALELDDQSFYPCTCGYQICRFCWHRIKTTDSGTCPACRKPYSEDPAHFTPLTTHELVQLKKEKKIKETQERQKTTEARKKFSDLRVVQKNLMFVVGLPLNIKDPEELKKNENFGRFGKILKVTLSRAMTNGSHVGTNHISHQYQSAYILFARIEDALRAIKHVNDVPHKTWKAMKASLGTTKYCMRFLNGTHCTKQDCVYVHEVGDEDASFSKEEIQQGKHTNYEQKLYSMYCRTDSQAAREVASQTSQHETSKMSNDLTHVNNVSTKNDKKNDTAKIQSNGHVKAEKTKDQKKNQTNCWKSDKLKATCSSPTNLTNGIAKTESPEMSRPSNPGNSSEEVATEDDGRKHLVQSPVLLTNGRSSLVESVEDDTSKPAPVMKEESLLAELTKDLRSLQDIMKNLAIAEDAARSDATSLSSRCVSCEEDLVWGSSCHPSTPHSSRLSDESNGAPEMDDVDPRIAEENLEVAPEFPFDRDDQQRPSTPPRDPNFSPMVASTPHCNAIDRSMPLDVSAIEADPLVATTSTDCEEDARSLSGTMFEPDLDVDLWNIVSDGFKMEFMESKQLAEALYARATSHQPLQTNRAFTCQTSLDPHVSYDPLDAIMMGLQQRLTQQQVHPPKPWPCNAPNFADQPAAFNQMHDHRSYQCRNYHQMADPMSTHSLPGGIGYPLIETEQQHLHLQRQNDTTSDLRLCQGDPRILEHHHHLRRKQLEEMHMARRLEEMRMAQWQEEMRQNQLRQEQLLQQQNMWQTQRLCNEKRWQDSLKALLPNVNVSFGPRVLSSRDAAPPNNFDLANNNNLLVDSPYRNEGVYSSNEVASLDPAIINAGAVTENVNEAKLLNQSAFTNATGIHNHHHHHPQAGHPFQRTPLIQAQYHNQPVFANACNWQSANHMAEPHPPLSPQVRRVGVPPPPGFENVRPQGNKLF